MRKNPRTYTKNTRDASTKRTRSGEQSAARAITAQTQSRHVRKRTLAKAQMDAKKYA